ncbi:DUF535 family protein [Pseudoduganella sp. R-34]|uniref:DUF535 family protein n=1 Tax=Pseudoduganella sp. R-34 TaxID=3404062 RepID=UPI003CEDF39B
MNGCQPRPAGRHACWALLLTALALLGALAHAVAGNAALLHWDHRLSHWCAKHATGWLTHTMHLISLLHSVAGILVLATLLAYCMIRARARLWLLILACGLPGLMLLNLLLKQVVARPRPLFDTLQSGQLATGFSFPSGHTALATMLYALGAAWLLSRTRGQWRRAAIVLLAAPPVVLVAASRVYLGAHYPSDVLAAMAEGLGWLAACLLAANALHGRRVPPPLGAAPPARRHTTLGLRLRALPAPRLARRWLALLNSDSALRDLLHAQPALAHKPCLPWFSLRLSRPRRVAALCSHYRFVLQRGWGGQLAAAARQPLELAHLPGRGGATFCVKLGAAAPLAPHGEQLLYLYRDAQPLYAMAFCFVPDDGRIELGIGGVLDACGESAPLLAHELHGLHPRDLLLRLLRQLGHALGCSRLLLVSDSNRPRRWRLPHRRCDRLWLALGAERRPDGDFSLPCLTLALHGTPDGTLTQCGQDLLQAASRAVLARLGPNASRDVR